MNFIILLHFTHFAKIRQEKTHETLASNYAMAFSFITGNISENFLLSRRANHGLCTLLGILKKKKKKKNPYKLKLSANAIWPARKVLDSSLYGCVSCVFLIKKKKF